MFVESSPQLQVRWRPWPSCQSTGSSGPCIGEPTKRGAKTRPRRTSICSLRRRIAEISDEDFLSLAEDASPNVCSQTRSIVSIPGKSRAGHLQQTDEETNSTLTETLGEETNP